VESAGEVVLNEVAPEFGARLVGVVLAAALFGAAAATVVGFALAPLGLRTAATGFRSFLSSGGWLWIPLWAAAIGVVSLLPQAPGGRARAWSAGLALVLALLPLVARPVVLPEPPARMPLTRLAKTHAIRKWAYGTPESVARILLLAHDPDPMLREQAVLALGVNLIVTDLEHASRSRPARYASDPLRARLAEALGVALHDSVESIRAEAARALWKAPVTFGPQPAAGETLAALLGRAVRRGAVERLSWLALDAAASHADAGLRTAALRFADATPDTALASAARRSLAP
jgi:hypothetical protein